MKLMHQLWRKEKGVSYPLSFVMIAPFYLMFMCFTVEVGFLLIARVGLDYAAHSAARSAVVWETAEPQDMRTLMPKAAAAQAMAAFVGGRQREVDDAGAIPAEAYEWAQYYADGILEYQKPVVSANPAIKRPYTRSASSPDAEFLKRKALSAWGRTEVKVESNGSLPHRELKVTVKFRAPLYLPVASKFLSTRSGAPYEYAMETTVTMPLDGPQTEDGTLGIQYQSQFPRK